MSYHRTLADDKPAMYGTLRTPAGIDPPVNLIDEYNHAEVATESFQETRLRSNSIQSTSSEFLRRINGPNSLILISSLSYKFDFSSIRLFGKG